MSASGSPAADDSSSEEEACGFPTPLVPFFERDSVFMVNLERGDLAFHGVPLRVCELVNEHADDTGNVAWDGAIVLAKYLEHALTHSSPI